MKRIHYKFLSHQVNCGTEAAPDLENVFTEKHVACSEAMLDETLAWVKTEAWEGAYRVEDFDAPEQEPGQAERLSDLEEALDMILKGVTE